MTTIHEIFERAKAGHVYVTDSQKYGLPEDWRTELHGDCDSFALWCREQIIAAGMEPPLLALCYTTPGDVSTGHLVCMTTAGEVLDNRQTRVCHMRDLRYQWISGGQFADGQWRSIS